MTDDLDRLADLIRTRRTSLLIDVERPVAGDLVDRLCELATWAPNHKKTWPWRFAVFGGDGRDRLGAACVADMITHEIGDETKRTKTLTKYRRAPVVVVIGSAAHDHPTFHDENRDAVAAGIQNLLLGATAAGLASFWSTAPVINGEKTLEVCGFETGTRLIGFVYLGWPSTSPPPGERPPVTVRHID